MTLVDLIKTTSHMYTQVINQAWQGIEAYMKKGEK